MATAIEHARQLKLMGVPCSHAEGFVCRCRKMRCGIGRKRCLFGRGKDSHRKRESKFHIYLELHHPDSLTEKEFLFHFRVSRECFWQLVNLLKGHAVFTRRNSDSRGKKPKPAEQQLLVLLKHCGCEGNSASSAGLANFFGVSSGVMDDCRNAALEALSSLEPRTHCWPSAKERKAIAIRIKSIHFFPHCVGLMDGALLPLSQRPLIHGENCLSRKKFCAVVMLVVCNDQARTLHCHIGGPGSVHDNRVWRTCWLFRKCNSHFSPKEHLLGDSAFTASPVVVPPHKVLPGSDLNRNQTAFNTLLARPRVKSEHCIGILKGRFPFLKCTRLLIGNKLHLKRIINYVRGTVTLHNFLIDKPVNEAWMTASEDTDDLDPEPATGTSNEPDCRRREELLFCLSELDETPIN